MSQRGGGKFRITPACAGNREYACGHTTTVEDHPRLRGEQASAVALSGSLMGSPPLARGTVLLACAISCGDRITPACAGNRIRCLTARARSWDHPRLRGEQPQPHRPKQQCEGSPPLARGTVVQDQLVRAVCGITPACAGNSGSSRRSRSPQRDHPRLRGEQTKKRLVVSCILQYRFSFFNQFFVDMFC